METFQSFWYPGRGFIQYTTSTPLIFLSSVLYLANTNPTTHACDVQVTKETFIITVHLKAQQVVCCFQELISLVISANHTQRPTCNTCCQSRDHAPEQWWRHVGSENEWPWGWRGERPAPGTRWSLCRSLCGASSATSHQKTTQS